MIAWVFDSAPTRSAVDQLVLLAIANQCRKKSLDSWPSLATLVRATRLSRRAVIKAINRLEAQGVLGIARGGGRSHSSVYTINVPASQLVEMFKPGESVNEGHPSDGRIGERGAPFQNANGAPRSTNGAPRALETVHEVHPNRTYNRTEPEELSTSLSRAPRKLFSIPPLSERLWNIECRSMGHQPGCKTRQAHRYRLVVEQRSAEKEDELRSVRQ